MKNKSTYSLLLNAEAEEKGRSIFEVSVYGLVLLCMAVSGWSFVSTDVTLPRKSQSQDAPPSMIANAVEEAPIVVSRG
ncbi:MAG: hypothetical protein ABIR71_04245 [Chthoniobacterales bacterium]